MTLDQLRYFYEAARFQHVGRAAKFVHISPSAISAAVAALEAELGCRLFERVGKSVVLTEAGRRLKGEAEKVFDQVTGIKARIGDGSGVLRGDYRIGASHFLASHYLTRAWSRMQNAHPDLSGEINALPTAQVLRELVNGTLDFGLCFSPAQHPDLKQIQMDGGRLVVVVRAGHPLLKLKGRRAVEALSGFPAVLHKGRPGVELCEAHPIFSRYGVTPVIRLSFDDDACAIERVDSSDSWAMIPDLVAKAHSKKVRVLAHPADWDASYFVALVFRGDREKNPAIQSIRVELEKLFRG